MNFTETIQTFILLCHKGKKRFLAFRVLYANNKLDLQAGFFPCVNGAGATNVSLRLDFGKYKWELESVASEQHYGDYPKLSSRVYGPVGTWIQIWWH